MSAYQSSMNQRLQPFQNLQNSFEGEFQSEMSLAEHDFFDVFKQAIFDASNDFFNNRMQLSLDSSPNLFTDASMLAGPASANMSSNLTPSASLSNAQPITAESITTTSIPQGSAQSFLSSQTQHTGHAMPGSMPEATSTTQLADHFKGGELISGDVPVWSDHSSGHIMGHGFGNGLNTQQQDGIASQIRANGGQLPDSVNSIVDKLDSLGAYNPGQSGQQKEAGAYLTLNTLGKMASLTPESLGNENAAAEVYGALKNAAIQGDGASVRELIESNGGDTFGLSDQELTDLWGFNEHNFLHSTLFGNSEVYNPIHMTSLNDKDMSGQSSGAAGSLGGFNDKGEYPQWGWYDDAVNLQAKFI